MLNAEDLKGYSAIIRDGFEFWNRQKGEKDLPSWQDIDPAKMKPLLPSLVVTHVTHAPLDFVDRIIGEIVSDKATESSNGVYWSEMPERTAESEIWKAFEKVVHSKQITLKAIPYVGRFKEFLRIEALICPIADSNGQVSKILTFVDYVSQNEDDITADMMQTETVQSEVRH